MIFGALENAEAIARMPEFHFEHARSKAAGYVAIKKALTAAKKSDFCSHVEAVCCPDGTPITDVLKKINVYMWDKVPVGQIESPAIIFGYPRYIAELDQNVVRLDSVIHQHIRHFNGNGLIICYDNNLYLKEQAEPYEEDVIALAALYYIAYLRGKFDAMKEHLKKAIEPIYTKVKYVPTARAVYDPDNCFNENQTKQVKRNGQGVDINTLYAQKVQLEQSIQRMLTDIAQSTDRKRNLERDIKKLEDSPNTCPAAEVIKRCLVTLKDQTVKIQFRDNEVVFTLESPIRDYDRAKLKRMYEERGSSFYRTIMNWDNGHNIRGLGATNNEAYRKFIHKLYKLVFIEEKYQYIVTNDFILQLYPLAYNWRQNGSGASLTGYTNPHLFYYNCWHDAQTAIANAYKADNYDIIPCIIKSTLEQMTFGSDIAPSNTTFEWYYGLETNNPARVFVDKDGYAYTIKELFELEQE